jgi:preprotein translocase subunit YajC
VVSSLLASGPALAVGTVLAKSSSKSSGGGALSFVLPIIILIALFYFLLIRPQRKRTQQAQQVRSNLVPGVEVMTTFGLYATVVEVHDNEVVLEVAPGVRSRFASAAVGKVVTPQDGGDGSSYGEPGVGTGSIDASAESQRGLIPETGGTTGSGQPDGE